jgi:hypothetical protein
MAVDLALLSRVAAEDADGIIVEPIQSTYSLTRVRKNIIQALLLWKYGI